MKCLNCRGKNDTHSLDTSEHGNVYMSRCTVSKKLRILLTLASCGFCKRKHILTMNHENRICLNRAIAE